jgi:hypothetical protein
VNRSLLLEKLEKYVPSSEEVASKRAMIQFVQNNPRCFERTLEEGHITGSAWLLSKDGSQALLTHHRKLDMWLQLGGHCDGDHDVLRVAIKEAQEESGIMQIAPVSEDIFDIDIHLIPANKKETAHYHYDVRFLLQVMSDEKLVISHESKELRWISKDVDTLPPIDSSVRRMLSKHQNYLRAPSSFKSITY